MAYTMNLEGRHTDLSSYSMIFTTVVSWKNLLLNFIFFNCETKLILPVMYIGRINYIIGSNMLIHQTVVLAKKTLLYIADLNLEIPVYVLTYRNVSYADSYDQY